MISATSVRCLFKSVRVSSHVCNNYLSNSNRLLNSCTRRTTVRNLQRDHLNDNRLRVWPIESYSTATSNFIANNERTDFDSVLSELITDLTEASKITGEDDIRQWFSKVLHYNIAGGKKIRGLNVVYSYKLLSQDINKENIKLSYVLGWCVEMLQGFFLVIDDVVDGSETRRGIPSWYKLEEVGFDSAINDGLLIESGMYKILKTYFKDKPYYLDIVELFHDTTLKTLFGQGLDLMTAKAGVKKDFTKFTEKRYFTITKYKSGYYTFHLPVGLALYMSGIKDEAIHKRCKDLLLRIGQFFQVQDDYLDCFGDSEITGKIGTDIQDGKCTWLAIKALQLADSHQNQLFRNHFGSSNPENCEKIKQIYTELDLPQLFKKYEEKTNEDIVKNIHELNGIPREIFTNLMKIINKRVH